MSERPPEDENPSQFERPGTGQGSDADERGDEVEFVETPAVEVGTEPLEEGMEPLRAQQPRRIGETRIIDEDRTFQAAAQRWLIVGALAVGFAVLMMTWSAIQVTGRDNAERILQESMIPLTELDALLASDYDAIIAGAAASDAELVLVPNYPLAITIAPEELALMSRSELRARILSESAAQIYDSGIDAFEREERGGGGGTFSAYGVMRFTIGQLTDSSHTLAQIVGGILLFLLIPFVAVVASRFQGIQRLRGMGAALALAGMVGTLVMLGVRAGLRTAADSALDPLNAALLEIGADASGIPIRNFIVLAILGLAIVAVTIGMQIMIWRAEAAPGRGNAALS